MALVLVEKTNLERIIVLEKNLFTYMYACNEIVHINLDPFLPLQSILEIIVILFVIT